MCLNQAVGLHPFSHTQSHTHSHTYTTFSSREFDLLTVITSLSLRPAVGTNTLPDTLSDRFRHKCSTYPMP